MSTNNKIRAQQQLISRLENSDALVKLKKRKADTRRKIELGGLVIKSGFSDYSKDIILGALVYAMGLIDDQDYLNLFKIFGTEMLLY